MVERWWRRGSGGEVVADGGDFVLLEMLKELQGVSRLL